ncbi:cupin domain-containing protein [Salinispirillum sp. LH 10-3-1]|uniref:Cupin domain-containing protein n=1 Tax=Salinispirillum sp. LH 10-3-1 TaxID=2952525 RepID=A0AB38YB85_9GAMM
MMLFNQMPMEEFLRDYWQKKPCLFRQALPDFHSPLSPDELAGLALEDEIESRLVIEHGDTPWQLRRGPFSEDDFARLPESNWTLLVQAVDQWVPEVKVLLEEFSSLPSWRLDDIMISFAPQGGSVGPHFDQYDVFLVQVEGDRHWDIGQMCDHTTALHPDSDLKIITELARTDGWDLNPGDVLYLPPGLAHHGVALNNCLTYSVGFRAPDAVEALQGLAQRLDLEPDVDSLRYSDTDLGIDEPSHTITPEALTRLRALLKRATGRDEALADWLGAYMTQNKYDLFDWADVPDDAVELSDSALVVKALPTRMAVYNERFYVNGRVFPLQPEDRELVKALIEDDHWSWGTLTGLTHSDSARDTLDMLILSGSLELPEEEAFAAPTTQQ